MVKPKTHSIDELNGLYSKAVEADREIFAEQRSNVLLIAGKHYSGKDARALKSLRETQNLPADVKIRLTKNHIQKIAKSYLNHIVSNSPGVKIVPRNEKEIQDQKCAQLNDSVWQYCADQMNFPMKVISLAKDYVDLGEAAVKIFWNPFAGDFKGYEQAVDENTGEPQVDPDTGELVADNSKPVFTGRLEVEKILPTNLFRDASATSMDESPFLGIRKMVPLEDAKKFVGNDPEKVKMLEPSSREEYMVFEPNLSDFQSLKGQVLFKEYYFRPCVQYPQGYFYITTTQGVLFEGEMPYGIFPIHYVGFDETQSSPRHRSIIKQLRPYQMEINRTASKIAEHQVTSDDKILIQNGTKISSGGVLPGVRAIQYSGTPPTVLEGRAGSQYVDYMNGQIAEMYSVANLNDDEKAPPGVDPYGLLFRSVKEQKKFTINIEKFENFIKQIVTTHQRLAKKYIPEDMAVPMVGRAEAVNIPEFKSSEDVRTQIKVMPMSDDINSMFGKWLAINHAIQYVGQNLEKEDIGRLMRQIPFGNFEESFGDFTLDYDLANNFILALERGELPEPSTADNKGYMVKRLEKRMRESDFKMLRPDIQQRFAIAKKAYEQMEVDEKMAIARAEQGFIPTGGPLIKTDLQVQEPNTTGGFKTTRAAFPVEALSWLQKQLEVQGSNLKEFQGMPQAEQADLATQFSNQMGLPPAQPGPGDLAGLTKNVPHQMAQGVHNGSGKPNPF